MLRSITRNNPNYSIPQFQNFSITQLPNFSGGAGGGVVVVALQHIVGKTQIAPDQAAFVAIDFALDVRLFGRTGIGKLRLAQLRYSLSLELGREKRLHIPCTRMYRSPDFPGKKLRFFCCERTSERTKRLLRQRTSSRVDAGGWNGLSNSRREISYPWLTAPNARRDECG